MNPHTNATVDGKQAPTEIAGSSAQPDEALVLRLSAQKLWAEG
jgi:hypothetical protein